LIARKRIKKKKRIFSKIESQPGELTKCSVLNKEANRMPQKWGQRISVEKTEEMWLIMMQHHKKNVRWLKN